MKSDKSVTNYVLDASVVLSWIAQPSPIQDALVAGEIRAYAPSFLRIEVVNVLSRKYRYAKDETNTFLSYLQKLPVQYIDLPAEALDQLVDFVYTYELSGYDALYLSVAAFQHCKLVSLDKKLLRIKEWVISPEQVK